MIDRWIGEWRHGSPLARGGICGECRRVLAEDETCCAGASMTWATWAERRGPLDRAQPPAPVPPGPPPGGVSTFAGLPEVAPDAPVLFGRVTSGAVLERIVRIDRPQVDIVFARFGSTRGCVVTLSDGRLVVIPAGPVRVVDAGGHTFTISYAHHEGTRLDHVDVRVGDLVTLVGAVEPWNAHAAGYRDPPSTRLRLVGLPALRSHPPRG